MARSNRERKPKVKAFFAGLLFAVATGLTIFATEIILLLLLHYVFRVNLELPIWNFIYQALVYLLALLILIFAPKLYRKLFKKPEQKISREELGFRGLPTWTDIGLSIVGIVAYFVLASIITYLFQSLFPWFDANQTQDVGFNNLYAVLDRIIAFVALVVVAPIAEETIFRGWLYAKLRARMSFVPAMLIVSLLFGIMHGQWNVGVNVFALSLVLCSLREITGTTYAGILVHILKNGLAFYLLYVVGM